MNSGTTSSPQYRASGGGGGYYGGGHGVHTGNSWPGGGGGSSFISGHDGCDAINESSVVSNIIHTVQSTHYNGFQFFDTVMIDGRGYHWTTERDNDAIGMPTYSGITTMLGNSSTGYIKITLLELF